MVKDSKIRLDGQLDRRGHSEGSKSTRFGVDDGRKRPGRSKGSKSLKTVYQAIAEMPVRANVPGMPKRISTKEGIVLKERDQALRGDHRAREHFLKCLAEYSPIEVELDRTGQLLADDEIVLADAFRRGILGVLPLDEPVEPSADSDPDTEDVGEDPT